MTCYENYCHNSDLGYSYQNRKTFGEEIFKEISGGGTDGSAVGGIGEEEQSEDDSAGGSENHDCIEELQGGGECEAGESDCHSCKGADSHISDSAALLANSRILEQDYQHHDERYGEPGDRQSVGDRHDRIPAAFRKTDDEHGAVGERRRQKNAFRKRHQSSQP